MSACFEDVTYLLVLLLVSHNILQIFVIYRKIYLLVLSFKVTRSHRTCVSGDKPFTPMKNGTFN